MSRRATPRRRELSPDRRYGNTLVTKFVSGLMSRGKRHTAESVFYGAMDIIEEKMGSNGLGVFNRAMNNVRPVLKVKSRRVGGSTYQVPVEVRPAERDALAIRWIIQYSRQRRGKSMADRLAAELMDAARGEGSGSVKKREETHKMAEANKAFAHYRW